MNRDRLNFASQKRTSQAIMTIINSLSPYTPEEKLLAANAVADAINKIAQTQCDITRHDLLTIIQNMNKQHESKTNIAITTIERIIKNA